MEKMVAKRLERLDEKLQQLLNHLRSFSDEQLNARPNPQSWSVLQILHHLMLAEQLSGAYVQKKLSFNPALKNINFATWGRMLLLRYYNYLPIKLKAPANVSEERLPERSNLADVTMQWQTQRQALRAYLSGLPQPIFQKEVYKHPIAGRLGLDGMVAFFEGHFDRHLRQINRILKALER